MTRLTRFVSRPVHRSATRDEIRSERDSRPSGKAGAPGAGGGGPTDSLLQFNSGGPTILQVGMG